VTLLLIPLAGIVLGVLAYLGLRASGVFNVLGAEPETRRGGRERGSRRERTAVHDRGTLISWPRFGYGPALTDRFEGAPRGCLYAIIAVTAIWILGWLVLLVVGLSILS
jgi:hypothetical protein